MLKTPTKIQRCSLQTFYETQEVLFKKKLAKL